MYSFDYYGSAGGVFRLVSAIPGMVFHIDTWQSDWQGMLAVLEFIAEEALRRRNNRPADGWRYYGEYLADPKYNYGNEHKTEYCYGPYGNRGLRVPGTNIAVACDVPDGWVHRSDNEAKDNQSDGKGPANSRQAHGKERQDARQVDGFAINSPAMYPLWTGFYASLPGVWKVVVNA